MAINKNHEFEELNGIKCAIVEKNVLPGRVEFLKKLLEYNHYTVIVVPSPALKVVAPPPATKQAVSLVTNSQDSTGTSAAHSDTPLVKPEEAPPAPAMTEPPAAPEAFTVGVTDYTFNPINAIFGRMLKTPDGHVVTQAYWYQKEEVSRDEIPYYEKTPKNPK